MTVGEAVASATRRLRAARLSYGHGTCSARDEAAWLVLHACALPVGAFGENFDAPMTSAQKRRLDKLLDKRIAQRIPTAYLTHEAWLGEHSFYVDRRVIVPRSFVAELLPEAIGPFLRAPVRSALDLCTGSGCLAILLALSFRDATVDAVDLSKAALAVARRNIANYRLGRRVKLLHSNLFESLVRRRYDLIVSNPPYVNAASMRRLPGEYLAEPRMALAGGDDGLLLVRGIIARAKRHLKPRGVLVCEIGHNREALEHAFPRLPFTWLDTSAGDGLVCLLEREHLPD